MFADKALPNRDRMLLWVANLLAISGLLSYAVIVEKNGFWRHDSWIYKSSVFSQFKYDGRWLEPFIHPYLQHWPPFLAWLIAVACLWFFGYRLAKRLLPITEPGRVWLATATGSVLIFIPGLLGNLEWPINVMATAFVLALTAHYIDIRRGFLIASAGTLAIGGLLQAFLPFTLLFFLPEFQTLNELSNRNFHLLMLRRLCFWIVVVLSSLLFIKALQFTWFGHIPAYPKWRYPHPIHNLSTLISNLATNSHIALQQIKQSFSWLGIITIALAIVIITVQAIRHHSNRNSIIALYYLLCSAGIVAFLYVATAPSGILLPFRISLAFGPALLLLFVALYTSTRSIRLVVFLTIVTMIFPFSVGFAKYSLVSAIYWRF